MCVGVLCFWVFCEVTAFFSLGIGGRGMCQCEVEGMGKGGGGGGGVCLIWIRFDLGFYFEQVNFLLD